MRNRGTMESCSSRMAVCGGINSLKWMRGNSFCGTLCHLFKLSWNHRLSLKCDWIPLWKYKEHNVAIVENII